MKITCVVDNNVLHASSMWGEHGLAFVIETDAGVVLFDTGQSGSVLLHNLFAVKKSLPDFKMVVLSHAHYDHTGGLASLLEVAPDLRLYAHPDLFEERLALRKKKRAQSIGLPIKAKKLNRMADVRLRAKPQELLPNLWTTGEIRKRSEPEGRSDRHVICVDGEFIPDPYRDDLSLVWKSGDGLVVILGCAHAGILNILEQVRETFDGPVKAVIGGTHLHGADEAAINHVARLMDDVYGVQQIFPNHCTGLPGYIGLAKILGNRVKPCPAGTTLEF